jgi:protein-S-isoprenylcysteine O-methyltransferase Ste14
MTSIDPYLIVRVAALYLTIVLTAIVWMWRRPNRSQVTGAVLAAAWSVPPLLALNVGAGFVGWWTFDARGVLLLGVPVDLLLAWAWLWGAIPAIAFRRAPIVLVTTIALTADLLLMPAAAPVVVLRPMWLIGEATGLLAVLWPAQLLARWTARDEQLIGRAVLQAITFAILLLLMVPAMAIEGSSGRWSNPFVRPAWQISLIAQVLAAPALVSLTAVQEFATRGGGTPVPFDPPRRLVTSGVYAYVRNPMQLSAVVLLLLLGMVLWNPWVAVAGLVAHVYSVGVAGWDEDADLLARFGDDWTTYRRSVRVWLPRSRPWHRPGPWPARLFVATSCGMCRDVGRWFEQRGASGLAIVPAETHPSSALRRITYEPADGSQPASGVEAVARALEHVHLGWALAGFVLRLPIVLPLVQLLVDAAGGEPRAICRTEPDKVRGV